MFRTSQSHHNATKVDIVGSSHPQFLHHLSQEWIFSDAPASHSIHLGISTHGSIRYDPLHRIVRTPYVHSRLAEPATDHEYGAYVLSGILCFVQSEVLAVTIPVQSTPTTNLSSDVSGGSSGTPSHCITSPSISRVGSGSESERCGAIPIVERSHRGRTAYDRRRER